MPQNSPSLEPRVQYVNTTDGVSLAFWTLGAGPPLVYLAGGPWSHIELWQLPECRRWYECLARYRTLVRYDMRGTGLSAREVTDYSLNALLRDVEAVGDRLGLRRFALLGAADAGPLAIAYAAHHPERVSRLLLWCAWARTAEFLSARIEAWFGLLERDWELATETCAHVSLGWSAGEVGRRAAEHLRQSVTRETAQAALAAMMQFDVTALLPQVQAPALVLHRRALSFLPVDVASSLAARLPDARLMVFEGESTAPYLGDMEAVAAAIDAFLSEERATPAAASWHTDASALEQAAASSRARAYPDGLSAREVEVLRLVASGRTNREIAEELVLSVRTVEQHIRNIYRKIHARGRADATAYTLTRGLL